MPMVWGCWASEKSATACNPRRRSRRGTNKCVCNSVFSCSMMFICNSTSRREFPPRSGPLPTARSSCTSGLEYDMEGSRTVGRRIPTERQGRRSLPLKTTDPLRSGWCRLSCALAGCRHPQPRLRVTFMLHVCVCVCAGLGRYIFESRNLKTTRAHYVAKPWMWLDSFSVMTAEQAWTPLGWRTILLDPRFRGCRSSNKHATAVQRTDLRGMRRHDCKHASRTPPPSARMRCMLAAFGREVAHLHRAPTRLRLNAEA